MTFSPSSSLQAASRPQIDREGINRVLLATLRTSELSKEAERSLKQEPKAFIQRSFQLTSLQRACLSRMPDDELNKLVSPIVKALESGEKNFQIDFKDEATELENLSAETEVSEQRSKVTVRIRKVITVEVNRN